MPQFIFDRLIDGQYDYKTIMALSVFAKYQTEVDALLVAAGRGDLIVAI